MAKINILAIETSCDETSVAVVQDGRFVLSNVISSQIDVHKKFGGVVPEVASRIHLQVISQIIDEAICKSQLDKKQIDAIAVTNGPGLVGALLVGVSYAKTFSYVLNKPLVPVNHIAGHICANYLENDFEPPFICCVVSGGHTNLVHVKDYNSFEILGKTRDDAAGEAYDKVARVLGLSYPGGPAIDNLAKMGDMYSIDFPQALANELDFSFSGVKSSVINFVNKNGKNLDDQMKKNIAASFQYAVANTILKKTFKACQLRNCKKIALAGGVSANSYLRKIFQESCAQSNYSLHVPQSIFCTDNAAMIASSAYFKLLGAAKDGKKNLFDLLCASPNLRLNAVPNMKLGD